MYITSAAFVAFSSISPSSTGWTQEMRKNIIPTKNWNETWARVMTQFYRASIMQWLPSERGNVIKFVIFVFRIRLFMSRYASRRASNCSALDGSALFRSSNTLNAFVHRRSKQIAIICELHGVLRIWPTIWTRRWRCEGLKAMTTEESEGNEREGKHETKGETD